MNSKEMISQIPLFSGLDEQELDLVFHSSTRKKFQKKSIVFQEGEPGDSFFMTVSGEGNFVLFSEDGKEIILSEFSKGDFFGEIAILDGKPRSSSVVTKTNCEFLVIEGKDLFEIMEGHPAVSIKVIKRLCERLRDLTKKVGTLTFLDATGRVAAYIMEIAKKDGTPITKGVKIEDFPHPHEISSKLGLTRESVSRVLKNMKKQGYITTTGENLIVHEEAFS